MKYYISYKGKIFGYTMTKVEAKKVLQRLNGTLEGLEIVEFNDKVQPFVKKNMKQNIKKLKF